MTHFIDLTDAIEGGRLGDLAQFEPAPDALDSGDADARAVDDEPLGIVWMEARIEYEWAATEGRTLAVA